MIVTEGNITKFYDDNRNVTAYQFHQYKDREGNELFRDQNGWYINDVNQNDITLEDAAKICKIPKEDVVFMKLRYGA